MHILADTTKEIEISENFLKQEWAFYKAYEFFIFPVYPFLRHYRFFCQRKQKFLLLYSSLYSDIKNDTQDTIADASDIQQVHISLLFITFWIEELSDYLNTLSPENDFERNILDHETNFVKKLLFAFNDDMRTWLRHHTEELAEEIQAIDTIWDAATISGGKEILLLQKKRLESHIKNITKI